MSQENIDKRRCGKLSMSRHDAQASTHAHARTHTHTTHTHARTHVHTHTHSVILLLQPKKIILCGCNNSNTPTLEARHQ